MALSEYEENILAELEEDIKSSQDKSSKRITDDGVEVHLPKVPRYFNAKKAIIGFVGCIIALFLIIFAVHAYSTYSVFITIGFAMFGFGIALYSIASLIESFAPKKK